LIFYRYDFLRNNKYNKQQWNYNKYILNTDGPGRDITVFIVYVCKMEI